jgi:hypothetical protein
MRNRELDKISALNGSVNTSAIHYVPLVFTSFGGIGPLALEHFKELARGWSRGQRVLKDKYLRSLKMASASCIQLNHASLTFSVCVEAVQKALQRRTPSPSTTHQIFQPPITPAPDTTYQTFRPSINPALDLQLA